MFTKLETEHWYFLFVRNKLHYMKAITKFIYYNFNYIFPIVLHLNDQKVRSRDQLKLAISILIR
jgi:hypothetical protein